MQADSSIALSRILPESGQGIGLLSPCRAVGVAEAWCTETLGSALGSAGAVGWVPLLEEISADFDY